MASQTAASGDASITVWMSNWTIFFWAWWISWCPFVGLFIARISRGRTIRQFVTGVLLVPSLVSLVWFAILGGGAIGVLERARAQGGDAGLLTTSEDGSVTVNFDAVLFNFLDALPVPMWVTLALTVLCVVLVAIFFVTGADSASIVMAGLTEKGAEKPSRWNVVFWGAATGSVAAVMLLAGGDHPDEALNGLKNITIVTALPFVVVMLVLCVSIWKDLSVDPMIIQNRLARDVLERTVATAVERHNGEPFELSIHGTITSLEEAEFRQWWRRHQRVVRTLRAIGSAPNRARALVRRRRETD